MRRGFTLIEMSVVLMIIAIVTHLAMRQLGGIRDAKLTAAANRQLEEVRAAVFGADPEGEPTGFLADTGRMPVVTNGTLAELWRCPDGCRAYAVLPAVKENFVSLDDTALRELTNAAVRVGTGWRGPYLRLPLGKERLTDPWGNPLENPDAAGFDRIAVRGKVAAAVSHFGPTALTNDSHRQTVSLEPAGGASSRLFVKVVTRGDGEVKTCDYRWYGPSEGRLTGGYTNGVPVGVWATFDGLTPGRRTVWDSVTKQSRLVRLRPGDNQIQIEVP